jgi:glycine cleavage system H protein
VIGISEYAAEALGDVVYVELPQLPSGGAGNWVGQGDAVGAVESVKSAADINAPLRLRVTQINGLLEDKPSTINQVPEDDSHGGGWLAKVEVDEESLKGWDGLMTPEEYKSFTSGH